MSTSEQPIIEFLNSGFAAEFKPDAISAREAATVAQVIAYVNTHIAKQKRPRKYVLGLALDFAMLAQRLSRVDAAARAFNPGLTEKSLFTRYELVTMRGTTTANTLTLMYHETKEGIRRIEEQVVTMFHALNRRGYPSAYVYNTGQWHKYKDLLVMCFSLSESGRHKLVRELIAFGIDAIPENFHFGVGNARVRIFEAILLSYPRSDAAENGGLVLQGLAHGFFAADRPHLSFIVDKVRTGSARQKRFGDIDCYYGVTIELSVEVKDMRISGNNYQDELGPFGAQVKQANVLGIVFCAEVDSDARAALEGEGVRVQSLEDTLKIVRLWDWRKQDAAVLATLHHITHIEQDAGAAKRLIQFIQDLDPEHESLASSW